MTHTVDGTGAYEGYKTWEGLDPHEDFVGPFYWKKTDEGVKCALVVEDKHCNAMGSVHGGMLATFADFALFAIAQDSLPGVEGVTINLTSDFCAAAMLGEFLEADGEIIRETGSMIFLRGRLFVGDRNVLMFSGIIKKPRPKG